MQDLLKKVEALDPVLQERFAMRMREEAESRSGTSRLVSLIVSDVPGFDPAADLGQRLPEYMVPSRFVNVDQIPRLSNGKPDLNAARELVPQLAVASEEKTASPLEQSLQAIWSEVLGFEGVGLNDNFFEIGGDSILSIQVIARAKKIGLRISPTDIFEHQTVAELAAVLKTEEQEDLEPAEPGELPLLPIQRWYFSLQNPNPSHWNQGIKIKLNRNFESDHVFSTVEKLVELNDALRVCFPVSQEDRTAVLDDGAQFVWTTYPFEKSTEDIVLEVARGFSLEEGPLFGAAVSDTGNEIIFVAHHLVSDPITWDLLYQQFSALLNGEAVIPASYVNRIRTFYENLIDSGFENSRSFWEAQVTADSGFGSFPAIVGSLTESAVDTFAFETAISPKVSAKDTEAIVFFGVTNAVLELWQRNELVVGLERQLRSSKIFSDDFAGSAGWLTSYFPVLVKSKTTHADARTFANNALGNIPDDGFSFGYLKFERESEELRNDAEVLLNYMGNARRLPFEVLTEGMRDRESRREYVLEINCLRKDDCLNFEVVYPYAWKDTDFAGEFEACITELLEDTDENAGVNKAGLSSEDLGNLFDQLN